MRSVAPNIHAFVSLHQEPEILYVKFVSYTFLTVAEKGNGVKPEVPEQRTLTNYFTPVT